MPPALPSSQSFWPKSRFAVSLAFFVNGFALGSWTPEVPIIGASLGLSPATYGFMILVFGLGAVAAMPIIGTMIARLGSRPALILTQLLLAASLLALALSPLPALSVAAIFFFGMGLGGMDVAINASAVSVERALDRAIMSSCHGFWSLGAFAGAGAGGLLIDAVGSLGHLAIVAVLVLLGLALLAPRLIDDRPAFRPKTDAARPPLASLLREHRTPLLLSVAIGVIALAGFVQEGVVIDWSAVFLRDELAVSVAASGFGFAAFSFTMAFFRFFGDGIRERFGAVRTVRLSLGFALAGLFVLALAQGLGTALFGFFLLGIGLSNVVPIAFSAAGNVRGLADGTSISIASAIAYSGGLVAPAAVGLVAAAYGFATVFMALAVICTAIAICANLLKGADRDGTGVDAATANGMGAASGERKTG